MTNRTRNSREKFLKAYQSALKNGWSIERLAVELGIAVPSIHARRLIEKKKGFTLKTLPTDEEIKKKKSIDKILKDICVVRDDAGKEVDREAVQDEAVSEEDLAEVTKNFT